MSLVHLLVAGLTFHKQHGSDMQLRDDWDGLEVLILNEQAFVEAII